jgi:predicted GNAT family N-acyltransferase
MNYHIAEITFGTPEYDEAVQLRYDILRKPLGRTFNVEDFAKEYEHFHLGYYHPSGQLLACLILTPLDAHEIKMRQVAVAENVQRSGVGRMLVHASEDFARERHFSKMVLNARETAVPFYERLEYTKVGDRFEEVGIPHFKMEKELR